MRNISVKVCTEQTAVMNQRNTAYRNCCRAFGSRLCRRRKRANTAKQRNERESAELFYGYGWVLCCVGWCARVSHIITIWHSCVFVCCVHCARETLRRIVEWTPDADFLQNTCNIRAPNNVQRLVWDCILLWPCLTLRSSSGGVLSLSLSLSLTQVGPKIAGATHCRYEIFLRCAAVVGLLFFFGFGVSL